MSDLRDRIADAIQHCVFNQKWYRVGPYAAAQYADAVIEELGLRQERKEVVKTPPKLVFTRYVTQWTPNGPDWKANP
jgi:hypothetical protein